MGGEWNPDWEIADLLQFRNFRRRLRADWKPEIDLILDEAS